MRILFISAFYPPYVIGGWEQLTQDINCWLQARRHVTHVLTSTYQAGRSVQRETHVSRRLALESDLIHYQPLHFFLKRRQDQIRNLQTVDNALVEFKPDVIFVHGMWNLWRGVPWQAEKRMPGRVVYYIADDWPWTGNIHRQYWRLPVQHKSLRLLKQISASIAKSALDRDESVYQLQFEHVLCVSETVRKNLVQLAGMDPDHLKVITNGIETDLFVPFPDPTREKNRQDGLSLLYVGSLVPTKGVHTAIEALALLNARHQLEGTRLTLVGSGHPDYEAGLKNLVRQNHLEDYITFRSRIPRREMPELFRQFDALVFPSLGEALPRIVQEAMACGLLVIGTTAGGTGEILVEGRTGLTFQPGDAAELADRIMQLRRHPELFGILTKQARELIVKNYDLRTKIDEIEQYLLRVIDGGQPDESGYLSRTVATFPGAKGGETI